MDNNILSALKVIDVAALQRNEWIEVGMALKHEGYPCSIWDDWSQNDRRYHKGECQRIWNGFWGSSKPVTGATIVKMAQERGWSPGIDKDAGLAWDDAIEYDGEDSFTGFYTKDDWNPVNDLITYLETVFEPDDRVGYVTNDVWQNDDGKWVPSKGVYDRTAGELIASLRKHPDDIGAAIGDWKPEAGAWIRFNPLDGEGVKNNNVTAYRYALVESDTIPVSEQEAVFRKLELPIATLVYSGGKSLHALVHIDAADNTEYQKRVTLLYDFMREHEAPIDTQNRNPSRLSRMPGVTRNGKRQRLIATNIGRKSWDDWMDFVEGVQDELPDFVSFADYVGNPPPLAEPLIEGIIRRGHKMLISGPSKAGKSYLLIELCVSIANGMEWLGHQCHQGRVLYVNLEIDERSVLNRIESIYETLGLPPTNAGNLEIWNLRGKAVPLDQLVPKLIRRVKGRRFDAIVIDPIYKVITGDENNASDMGAFCNQFDKICAETGCSTIYCHHHSKGAQGNKKAMDRASGSGVFARDPDAQLDIIELELTPDIRNNVAETGATAWRLESSLREFPNIQPVNFWFEHPVHRLDTSGELEKLFPTGSQQANLQKSGKRSMADEDKAVAVNDAFNVLSGMGPVRAIDMAEYMDKDLKTVKKWLALDGDFTITNGIVMRSRE